MDIALIMEFIKPEVLVLIPVLYLIGAGLKAWDTFSDRYIPITLGCAGIVLALLYLAAVSELRGWPEIAAFLFAGVTQGILAAGGSVYANQVYKQAGKDD